MTYLTDEPIDQQQLVTAVMRPSDGALALFAGVVRDHHAGRVVESIVYECWRPMAEKEMAKIAGDVAAMHPEVAIAFMHRLGLLRVGEASIVIACASAHREPAFAACREVIERVKQTVPIWKREKGPDGEEWVGWQKTNVSDAMLPKGAGSAGEVVPVRASSTILLRGEPFEVLMMRRHESSTFVPGVWVFPGGALDEADVTAAGGDGEDTAYAFCAVRELLEETGIWIGSGEADPIELRRALVADASRFREMAADARSAFPRLVPFERWITPAGVPKRYDTLFLLAKADEGTEGTPDEREGVELVWIRPADALARNRAGSMKLVFATIRILETLASHESAASLVAACAARATPVRRPVLVVEDGRKSIVLSEPE